MRAKAPSICGIEIDVDIMRIRCSCFVKNLVNQVECALIKGAKEAQARHAKQLAAAASAGRNQRTYLPRIRLSLCVFRQKMLAAVFLAHQVVQESALKQPKSK